MTDSAEIDLTEMEGLALGLVKQMQPTSAYTLAATFANSPSAYWSGSAGAIYPLVRRLHKAKLLTSAKAATGKRKSTVYSLSRAGEAAFQSWLLDVDRAANPGFDPLRSRLSMLQLAPAKARSAFLDEVEGRVTAQQKEPLSEEHSTDWFRALHATWLRSRVKWLKDIRKLLAGG